MEGDFALDPLADRGFSRVLMQQGRVLLPSDWNEQVAAITEQMRLLARDLIGPYGGPDGDSGFAITRDAAGNLTIGAGRYWVDGIAIEHRNDKGYALTKQPYYNLDAEPATPCVVYLDVHEIHISAAQDRSLFEVALGGPDTASRAKVIWQVRAVRWVPPQGKLNASQLADAARGAFRERQQTQNGRRPTLSAIARNDGESTDACTVSPDAAYRGMENQLYRVEIHDVPATDQKGPVHFKWSRDNGSIVFPAADVAGTTAHLRSLGRDARTSVSRGSFVEVVDDSVAYNNPNNALLTVKKVLRDSMTVEFEASSPLSTDDTKGAILRRWDSPLLEVPAGGGTVPLEAGITVAFSDPETTDYRAGDYWLIPARVATGDVIWPKDASRNPIPRPPDGPRRHYAPLAYCGAPGVAPVDLRFTFKSAVELT